MNKDLIESIVLLVIAMILILIYGIFVIIDERKKWNKKEFFKYTLYYEVDYFLYMDMIKKMNKQKDKIEEKIKAKKKILGLKLVD